MSSSFVHGLFALLALVSAPSIAQPDIVKVPVQFAKGKTGASIQGSVKGNQTVYYTLRAASGQTMTVVLSGGSPIHHNVLPPGSTGDALFVGSRDDNRSSITLPTPGEYTVRVHQMGNAASDGKRSNFGLDIAIAGGTQTTAVLGGSTDDDGMVEASARASEGKFNATGKVPCAWAKSQPMGHCDFGVARAGGGTAAVAITRPDRRNRVIFFKAGKAVGADTSQADGDMGLHGAKEGDHHRIETGNERYEIPDGVIFGG